MNVKVKVRHFVKAKFSRQWISFVSRAILISDYNPHTMPLYASLVFASSFWSAQDPLYTDIYIYSIYIYTVYIYISVYIRLECEECFGDNCLLSNPMVGSTMVVSIVPSQMVPFQWGRQVFNQSRINGETTSSKPPPTWPWKDPPIFNRCTIYFD